MAWRFTKEDIEDMAAQVSQLTGIDYSDPDYIVQMYNIHVMPAAWEVKADFDRMFLFGPNFKKNRNFCKDMFWRKS